jgi:hypothetical protein
MNTINEFFEKTQTEFLNGLKQAQELNVKTLSTITELVSKVPSMDAKEVQNFTLPTATEVVEKSFAFTNELIATRKEYFVKLAEFATEAQTQFADAAKRIAAAAQN